MDKKILKKVLLVLSILFIILTFAGAVYVLLHKGQVSAGYSAVPMLWAVLFTTTYNKVKKEQDRNRSMKKNGDAMPWGGQQEDYPGLMEGNRSIT